MNEVTLNGQKVGTLGAAFARFQQRTDVRAEKIIQLAAEQLKDVIQTDTPVLTGRARAGWKIEWVRGVLRVFNSVPYIRRLEYGWSKQAPAGMVRVNLKRFSQFLREAVAQGKRQ